MKLIIHYAKGGIKNLGTKDGITTIGVVDSDRVKSMQIDGIFLFKRAKELNEKIKELNLDNAFKAVSIKKYKL